MAKNNMKKRTGRKKKRINTRALAIVGLTTVIFGGIAGGLVYIADCGKTVHCVDAETGKPYWTHEMDGEMWTSTLVADGKVYIGSQRRDFVVLAAGKTRRVLSTVRLDSPIHASAAAANGTLYVATMRRLYALRRSAK